MSNALIDTAPDFSQPIAVLKHCHDRIRKQLQTLQNLLAHLPQHGADTDAQKAAQAVLKYFNNAAHLHHEDEEQNLIPMLQATARDADATLLAELTPGILSGHEQMDRDWTIIKSQLEQIANGSSSTLSASDVSRFCDTYAAHMVVEESNIAPMAKRLFSAEQMAQLGSAMQVRRGEIYGFLGPNGSGKTTSIRMMCGLLTPDSGSGHTLGYDITQQAIEIKRHVGYMTQRFGLYDDLSLRENLDFIARIYGMKERKPRVQQALERLGLAGRQNQLAGTLSGGWKQRLALAACMLHEPQLLLLDEPTAGVDPKARRDFWDEIHELAADGMTVLVSTHYMDEAERCHRLGYIAYGKLLACGTPKELIQQSQFITWQVEGRVDELVPVLQHHSAVALITRFGTSLHINGLDAEALAQAIAPFQQRSDLHWQLITPQLEDVFIHLMQQSQDNFR